ncbi:TetR/AcrR family transcriptional regulator [Streptomyces sp. NPDC002540]
MSDLLERGGRDAVTTRAVAGAADLRPPALYRLFGGKEGLPDAVAEYGFTRFLAAKQHIDPAPQDPVEELRDGWDTVVEFGPANPALYTLMYGEPTRSTAVFRIGLELLMERIRHIAAAVLLRVEEGLAAQIVHATAADAVLTWLSVPAPRVRTSTCRPIDEQDRSAEIRGRIRPINQCQNVGVHKDGAADLLAPVPAGSTEQ